MITILTSTNHKQQVEEIINSIDRLHELVTVSLLSDEAEKPFQLKVIDEKIYAEADWLDSEPPYLFSEVDFSPKNLLALVFFKLDNHQKALEFTSEDSLLQFHIMMSSSIKQGFEIDLDLASEFLTPHNECIIKHYGNINKSFTLEQLKILYLNTLINEDNADLKAFTLKHYCNLLFDAGLFAEAEELIRTTLRQNHLKPIASTSLKNSLASAMMSQLQFPFDSEKINGILELQKEGIDYYEAIEDKVNAGLLYVNAAEVASYKNDYVTSKDYINKAILIFKNEEIPEFLGEASLRKASLLYSWSKNGSPQYYKPAINAFQDTLKIFKRDSHPEQFADIHHNLALIYSEMPASVQEKPIWTAFCASSFKEALTIFTQENYPYQYAMVCHNYATALMSFPEAKLHDNLDKANGLFEESLKVRTAKTYSFERALTLTNQLELLWLIHNETEKDENNTLELMFQKAQEIKTLVDDSTLIKKADEQMKALKELKTKLGQYARNVDSK
jgi:hypothetical protein